MTVTLADIGSDPDPIADPIPTPFLADIGSDPDPTALQETLCDKVPQRP